MRVHLALHEFVDVTRQRVGISRKELAARMGWPPGTLDSYLFRLRHGRTPTRTELDALAGGLADPRSPFTAEMVLRPHLYAAAGITPTPEEIAEFAARHFPHASQDPNPCLLMDTRGFVRWVSPTLARLVGRMGGPSPEEVTVRAHAWVLGASGAGRVEPLAVDKILARVPDLFALRTGPVSALTDLTLEPVHMMELSVDPGSIAPLLAVSGEETSEPVLDELAWELRYMEGLWPRFRASTWYGPIDRRLCAFPAYREALRRSGTAPQDMRPDLPSRMDATGLIQTALGTILYCDTAPLLDPRFVMSRLIPASEGIWRVWQTLA